MIVLPVFRSPSNSPPARKVSESAISPASVELAGGETVIVDWVKLKLSLIFFVIDDFIENTNVVLDFLFVFFFYFLE